MPSPRISTQVTRAIIHREQPPATGPGFGSCTPNPADPGAPQREECSNSSDIDGGGRCLAHPSCPSGVHHSALATLCLLLQTLSRSQPHSSPCPDALVQDTTCTTFYGTPGAGTQLGPTSLPSKDTVSKGLGTLAGKMAPKGQATLSEVGAAPARQSKALTSFAGKCTKNSALPRLQLTLFVWMVWGGGRG